MKSRSRRAVQTMLEEADGSLLELVDHVLNKGVVIDGEVLLGLANIDLIYLRLSAVLCAADVITAATTARRSRRGARR